MQKQGKKRNHGSEVSGIKTMYTAVMLEKSLNSQEENAKHAFTKLKRYQW